MEECADSLVLFYSDSSYCSADGNVFNSPEDVISVK